MRRNPERERSRKNIWTKAGDDGARGQDPESITGFINSGDIAAAAVVFVVAIAVPAPVRLARQLTRSSWAKLTMSLLPSSVIPFYGLTGARRAALSSVTHILILFAMPFRRFSG